MRRIVVAEVAAVALLALPAAAWGQGPVSAAPRVEARIGNTLSPRAAPFAGMGVTVRSGWYARLGVAAEGGAQRAGDAWHPAGRVSASARFLLDPFGDRRVGLYGGAGLGWRFAEGAAGQGALFLVLGAEGNARTRRVVPAFEVTLGGGVHATLVLRARRADSR
jgi:hypothetical protein